MHLRSLVLFTTVLALAACGEEQAAQAPVTPATPPTVETAKAPAASSSPAVTAQVPATGAAAPVNAPAPVDAPAPSDTTGTVTAVPPAGHTQTAATSATSLERFHGRAFSAGPISLQLNPDKTFVMNEVDGNRKVQGHYAYENGVLTLSQPTGDIGQATFPMRCRFETLGAGDFRLTDEGGACTRLKDLTFKPTAG